MTGIRVVGFEPVLLVPDIEATIQYYTEKLEFELDWTYGDPVDHASLSFGGSEESDHFHIQMSYYEGRIQPTGWFYVTVANGLDELFHRYHERGVKVVYAPADQPWGMREFQIEDDNGYSFKFAQVIHV